MSNHIKDPEKPNQPLCNRSGYDRETDLHSKQAWENLPSEEPKCWECASITN